MRELRQRGHQKLQFTHAMAWDQDFSDTAPRPAATGQRSVEYRVASGQRRGLRKAAPAPYSRMLQQTGKAVGNLCGILC